MHTPQSSPEVAQQLGLLPEEFDQITEILGRTPNFTELSIFSVMWSEHCSYKNSILQLKTLPNKGKRVLAGAGEEGAGLMDIGHDLAVAFKIESHNHPSAIEPYQGAATGVGGIHRDIFSMGARPIASLNSLRFGDLENPQTQHLLKGVVKGIGDYGNAFGVPTVAGEIYFDPCYTINPLVNAMSVGIAKKGMTASAIAKGTGNPVYIVGSATGKDGIHGATFASEDISEESEAKLPSVQVGDPFAEKLALEATLEAIATGALIGVQDMGAAGITCATSEMTAKGEVGMDIWLDKVPMRQADMQPFEILLSESQERMLLVVKKGREAEIEAIFDKWDLHCAQIAVVTDTDRLRYYMHEELVADIPAQSLVLGGGAPVYTREQQAPAYLAQINAFDPNSIAIPENYKKILEFLLQIPSIASKKWVTEQYDSMVGTANLSTNAPSDAAVVRVQGYDVGLAVTTDCNARYVHADPRAGAALAVSEAARNLVCTGAEPIGVTNCLNFGNPYNPEVYWQFAQAIKGMGEACRKFDTPITGGNVSLYNQSEDGPVFPTPTIGMVGLIEELSQTRMSMDFKAEGDLLYILGEINNDINSSAYLYNYHQVQLSPAPTVDIDQEKSLQDLTLGLIKRKLIRSAHDVSDGGLALTLLESSFVSGLGFEVSSIEGIRKDAYLFGEAGGRIVVSVAPAQQKAFLVACQASEVPCTAIGKVAGASAMVDGSSLGSISALQTLYESALPAYLSA